MQADRNAALEAAARVADELRAKLVRLQSLIHCVFQALGACDAFVLCVCLRWWYRRIGMRRWLCGMRSWCVHVLVPLEGRRCHNGDAALFNMLLDGRWTARLRPEMLKLAQLDLQMRWCVMYCRSVLLALLVEPCWSLSLVGHSSFAMSVVRRLELASQRASEACSLESLRLLV
jgi:hypothetical protein